MHRVSHVILLFCLCLQVTTVFAGNNIYGPPDHNGPIEVQIGFFLNNINDISEEDETFDFDGVLSMRWHDPRLAFDPAETGYDEQFFQGNFQFNEVFTGWWPQLYLANEAGRYERQGTMLRITPEGEVDYREEIGATAKSRMNLRRFPFDEQKFVAIFEVLGMDKRDVVLRHDPTTSGIWQDAQHRVNVPQWGDPSLSSGIVEYDPTFADGQDNPLTAFQVRIDMKRDSWYMMRLVVLPVMIFVFLSWSVFWMDRSSVGDRMDITFIGILTVVAYQIMFSESLPKISYLTVLMSFMVVSFLMMCAIVLVNLRVAAHDKAGRSLLGDRMDNRCRYIFPITYFTSAFLAGWIVYHLN